MLQENKARQIFREANIFYPLIRTRTWGYHVRNVRFRKMWRSVFSYNTHCEIRPFVVLPRNSAATRTILLIRRVLPVRFRLLFPASSLRLVPFPSFFYRNFIFITLPSYEIPISSSLQLKCISDFFSGQLLAYLVLLNTHMTL